MFPGSPAINLQTTVWPTPWGSDVQSTMRFVNRIENGSDRKPTPELSYASSFRPRGARTSSLSSEAATNELAFFLACAHVCVRKEIAVSCMAFIRQMCSSGPSVFRHAVVKPKKLKKRRMCFHQGRFSKDSVAEAAIQSMAKKVDFPAVLSILAYFGAAGKNLYMRRRPRFRSDIAEETMQGR